MDLKRPMGLSYPQTYPTYHSIVVDLDRFLPYVSCTLVWFCVGFRVQVKAFVSLFERTAPFGIASKRASSAVDGGSGSGGTATDPGKEVAASYRKLDEVQLSLRQLEAKAASMRELEELFELSPTRHTGLVEVRTQLRLLKMVWDMVSLVNGLFASWTATLWADIKTDELLEEAR